MKETQLKILVKAILREALTTKGDCQKCKGQGHYTTKLKDLGGRSNSGVDDTHTVSCDVPGCKNGKFDPQAYYDSMGVKEFSGIDESENDDIIFKDRQSGQDVYWIDNKDTGGRIQLKPENVSKYLRQGYEIVTLERESTIRETDVGDQHLINGQSNVVAAGRVNKVLSSLSKGLFSDNSWEAIHKIFNKLQGLGLEVSITSTKYGGQSDSSNGMPKFKEWQISIPFTNKNGKPAVLTGQITAHGAGSVEQPLDRYDITAYVSPIMVKGS
jgi:hypothetical protein